jgi:hypothetical protein
VGATARKETLLACLRWVGFGSDRVPDNRLGPVSCVLGSLQGSVGRIRCGTTMFRDTR